MRAQFFLQKNDPAPAPAAGTSAEAQPVRKKRHWFGTFLLVLLFLALAGGLGYVGKLYWDAQNQLKVFRSDVASKVNNLTDEEINVLVADVGKHIALPMEKPQVVTITNVDQLKINQPFFANAQNGDKILVFTNRVVLYRPSLDKVIDLAQIKPSTESAIASPSALATPEVTSPSPSPIPSITQ